MRFLQTGLFALACVAPAAAFAADKVFDPARDPAKDLAAAETVARAQGKHIFLDVGGNWCSWCLIFERTLQQAPELNADMQRNYVVVHVNWSPDNQNTAFLSRYAKIEGFPHFIILSADGTLLKQQDTSELETDHKAANGYDVAKVHAFLQHWAPGAKRS